MEHKIGEIFEYNGEWYQCIKADPIIGADGIINYCERCAISASECDNFNCIDYERLDKELVIFKKLEKVGEPFERNGYMYQEYKAHTYPLLMNGDAKIPTPNGFAVIIKQNKEDMEEREYSEEEFKNNPRFQHHKPIEQVNNIKKMKPFNLEAAKAGKPVCTRDGRKARIICFDYKGDANAYPILALISTINLSGVPSEIIAKYTEDGRYAKYNNVENNEDLMMLPEKKEGWVNVYHGLKISERVCGNIVSNTKEEAIQYAQDDHSYITTVKISWEE